MDLSHFKEINLSWEAFGLFGQTLFGFRFFYQWMVSEREKKSVVPVGFWWISIAGSVMTLIYAYHKAAPAFIIPSMFGVPAYIRNLMLIYREKKRLSAESQ